MLNVIKKLVVTICAYGVMIGNVEACSVNIEVTGETTVPAGAEPLALGAKTSDCKKTTFQWNVKGVGSLDEPTEQTLFYTPPSTIDGNKKQAIISVTVTEADGNEASDSVTLTIVGGDIPPTPTPETTDDGDSQDSEISCPSNFGEINTDKIAEWKKQGEKNIPQRGVIAALLGVGSQKGQKKREITLVWIENGQQSLACWSTFPEGTTEKEYLSEVRNAVPEFPKVDFKMLKRLNELWKQDKHVVLLP